MTVERWDAVEIVLQGPAEGNPFVEQRLQGTFAGKNETVTVDGFYDGGGVYKVRFMPSFVGEYRYETTGSFPQARTAGSFTVTPAGEGNHGPVRVAETYHFAYEDGTPYYSVGTTTVERCVVIDQTLKELDRGCFNKLRFCVFPKHYIHNFKDPQTFPYVGTPVDASGLTEENFTYQADFSGNSWDFTRFNPEHFRRVERAILQLRDRGIEADLIVMHPYDRWGFSQMTREQDDLYWKYCIARFAAYRNLWWSLANEYDLMKAKTLEDWERYAGLLCEKDPYNHLRSVHNCMAFYDYTRPWVTHCSMQRQDLYRHVEYTDDYRVRYGKARGVGRNRLRGEPGHGLGEHLRPGAYPPVLGGQPPGAGTPATGRPFSIRNTTCCGGATAGSSTGRARPGSSFCTRSSPRPRGWGCARAPAPSTRWWGCPSPPCARGSTRSTTTALGAPASGTSRRRGSWRVEVIDTWEMTVTDAGVHTGKFRIPLPGKEWMAIRLTRCEGGDK